MAPTAATTVIVPNRDTPGGVRKAAQDASAGGKDQDETPTALRWMLKPLKRGMFVRLPVIDTDPNRGLTYGIMPIVVLQGKNDDRIEQIHAPSLNYNKDFGLSPTYRYYYYPQEDAAFAGRVSRAKYEHEAMAEYTDHSLFGTPLRRLRALPEEPATRASASTASGRTRRRAPSSQLHPGLLAVQLGQPSVPVVSPGSPFRVHLSQRYIASRILDGPLKGLPHVRLRFSRGNTPTRPSRPTRRASISTTTRATTRVTTSRGIHCSNAFAEASVRGFLSEYDYERYGAESRFGIKPVPDPPLPGHRRCKGRYEQIIGSSPAFLAPAEPGRQVLAARVRRRPLRGPRNRDPQPRGPHQAV